MTLEDARRELSERQGEIKGWALHEGSFGLIAAELGVVGIKPTINSTLFQIPVVFVERDAPEGVIV